MKHIILSIAVIASGGLCQAQSLVLSDFSNFQVDYYSFPTFGGGAWSDDTALSGPDTFTLGDFGSGTPSAASGNAIIQWLGSPQDWSIYDTLVLTGYTPSSNQTDFLYFRIEDNQFQESTSTAIRLSDFETGLNRVEIPLDFAGIDRTSVEHWGFTVKDYNEPAAQLAFTFDQLELVAIPEPSLAASLLGLGVVAVSAFRRRRLAA